MESKKWAGTFECDGPCRRKRLMGNEFSNKSLERYRKDRGLLRCKHCISAGEQAERAASKKPNEKDGEETRKCAGKCSKDLSKSAFNRNQWSKGESKSRCRDCVELSIQEESCNQAKANEEKIRTARKKAEEAKKSGNVHEMIAAESELAALEATQVTGLKPVKMSSTAMRGGRRRGRKF